MGGTLMRKILVLTAMLLATLTTAASAQVYVRIGPPAPRYERVPPPPYRDSAWDRGHYRWDGGRYVWMPGRYVRGQGHWVGGHWSHGPRGHYWVEGHWG